MLRFKLTLFLCAFMLVTLNGQGSKYNGDPDASFSVARELAFNQQRNQARDTLLFILTKYPNYHDIREFLGATYSWDGLYEDARKAFSFIIKKTAARKDTWKAWINNELWAGQSLNALDLANRALLHFPHDADFLYQKANAQIHGDKPAEAFATLQLIRDRDPGNVKAINFENFLNDKLSFNRVGLATSHEFYSKTFNPMHYYAFKYGRQTKFGSAIARFNIHRRFESTGTQFEVDLYPRIVKGLYAYVNLGTSGSFLFPDFRYAIELFTSLPHSLEASLGFRALKYSTGTTVIYTGSVGWYTGNSYLYFRPYIIPNDSGFSKSGSINFRKYRSDAYNYSSISIGVGFSPLTDRFDYTGLENSIINLKSQSFSMGHYFTTSRNKLAWGINAGISRQEISFNPGHFNLIYSISISWDLKFK